MNDVEIVRKVLSSEGILDDEITELDTDDIKKMLQQAITLAREDERKKLGNQGGV